MLRESVLSSDVSADTASVQADLFDDSLWLSEEELSTWRALQRMQLQLLAALNEDLAGSGLSYRDYLVLAVLSEQPSGRARAGDLGRELGWEKSRLSHRVNSMVARGFVSKVRCDSDLRGAFVELSERGWAQVRSAAPGHVQAVRKYFLGSLEPGDLAVLRRVAESVLERLDLVDGVAVSEVRSAS